MLRCLLSHIPQRFTFGLTKTLSTRFRAARPNSFLCFGVLITICCLGKHWSY